MSKIWIGRTSTLALIVLIASFGCGGERESAPTADLPERPTLDAESPEAKSPETKSPKTESPATANQETARDAAAGASPEKTAASPAESPAEEGWGHLRGRFVMTGDPPPPQKLTVTKDTEVCGKHNLVDESLSVNQENGGIKNVIVWLYQGRGTTEPKVHPSYADTADATVVLDNDGCRFEPHVTLLRTSQKLQVINSDPVAHNTKVDMFSNTPFNQNLPVGGSFETQLQDAERLPAVVSCSIHPWMSGRLVVQAHPYMAVTDENGNFEIQNLPAGTWTFQVYHEAAGYLGDITQDTASIDKRGRMDVEITSGAVDLGELKFGAEAFEQ